MPNRKLKYRNRPIRQAIREIFEPAVAMLGFTGKYPEWRRETKAEVHFIAIQTEKYGGSFSVQCAWARRVAGTSWDDHTIAHTDFDQRAALSMPLNLWNIDGTPCDFRSKAFDYRFMLDDPVACRALVQSATDGLPALDHWLRTRERSPEIASVSSPIGSAPNAGLLRRIAAAKAELGLY